MTQENSRPTIDEQPALTRSILGELVAAGFDAAVVNTGGNCQGIEVPLEIDREAGTYRRVLITDGDAGLPGTPLDDEGTPDPSVWVGLYDDSEIIAEVASADGDIDVPGIVAAWQRDACTNLSVQGDYCGACEACTPPLTITISHDEARLLALAMETLRDANPDDAVIAKLDRKVADAAGVK